MTALTPSELRELHGKSTQGEWVTLRDGALADVKARHPAIPHFYDPVASEVGRRDAAFIAAAHNSLSALLDRIEQLESALRAARGCLRAHHLATPTSTTAETIERINTLLPSPPKEPT